MTTRIRPYHFLASAALLLAACGSDSKSSPATTVTPTTVTPTTVPAATVAPTTATAATEPAASEPAATDAAPATSDAPATASSDAPAASDGTSSSDAGTTTTGTEIALTDSKLGSILTTADGKTLYLFTKDSGTTSACSGGCATAWPPLTGDVTPGTGLDEDDFSTITRDDGTEQVTYYGHPLYFFAGDAAPGDVNGQAENAVWYVVGPDGDAIGADATTATTG